MAATKHSKSIGRMSTRNSPPHEEEQGETPPPNITNLFSEVVKMSNMLQSVAADVSTIKQTTSELNVAVAAMQERLTEAETRISRSEDTSERLHTAVGERSKLMEAMLDRMQVLENHSKRNNVRVIGLKETIGTDGTLLSCVRKMLIEGLGVRDDAEFEIERAHRIFAPLPDPNRAPRPVLIRFLRQSARDKVIMAAKEKRGFEWQGCRLSVFPDMTKELAEKRKAFTAVKKKLQERNAKYTLAFPATLRVRWKGKNLSFSSAKAAEKFFNEESREENEQGEDTPNSTD